MLLALALATLIGQPLEIQLTPAQLNEVQRLSLQQEFLKELPELRKAAQQARWRAVRDEGRHWLLLMTAGSGWFSYRSCRNSSAAKMPCRKKVGCAFWSTTAVTSLGFWAKTQIDHLRLDESMEAVWIVDSAFAGKFSEVELQKKAAELESLFSQIFNSQTALAKDRYSISLDLRVQLTDLWDGFPQRVWLDQFDGQEQKVGTFVYVAKPEYNMDKKLVGLTFFRYEAR